MINICIEEFEKIYIEHHRNIVNIAYHIVLDKDYALDIAQEVFLKLLMYIGNGKCIRNIQSWLILTAKHTSIDFIRNQSKFRITSLNGEINEGKDYADDIIKRTYLTSVLYNLKCKNQLWYDMILMKYLLGLSTDEIAKTLGFSNKSIENNLRRAKIYIKEQNSIGIEDLVLPLLIYFILLNHY